MPRYLSGLLTLVLAGCGTTLPEGALTGQWGAARAGVTATSTMVEVRMPCIRFAFPAALKPDSDGMFAVEGVVSSPSSVAGSDARLEGQATGDRLIFRVLWKNGPQWVGGEELHIANRSKAYSPGNPTCLA